MSAPAKTRQKAEEVAVADDQGGVEAPKPEAQATPLTLQAWGDKQNALIDEAIAANLPWGPALATIVAKRGMSLFDQMRAGLVDLIDRGLASYAKAEKK